MSDCLPSVLIIDGDAEDRAALRRYLNGDYRILDAARGDQGLALYAEHQPDCVILDDALPDMNGLEVLRALRSQRSAACAIVMVTRSSDTAAAVRAMKSGAHDYLDKNTLQVATLNLAVQSALGTAQADLSERQHTLDLLRESEERFRLIVETANEGVWTLDLNARTTYANDRLARMLGCARSDMMGLSALDFVFAEDHASALNYIERTQQGEIEQFDFRLCRKDGEAVWVLVGNCPLRDAQSRIVGTLMMLSDITGRRETQRALEASNERFSTAFHANPLALAIGSFPDGNVLDMNVAWIRVTGFNRDDIVGKTTAEFGFYVEQARRAEYFRQLKQNGNVHNFEAAIRTAGGEIRDVLMSSDIIMLDGRRCLLSSITDITERKALEAALHLQAQKLQYADRQKNEFLAMLAHELRNPLAPIRNAVRILQLISMPEPHAQEARDIIGRQVDHLSHLVDDLLDVSRITHGKITLHTARLELGQILANAVGMAQPLIEARKHTLGVSVPSTPIMVDGDATRLVQIFGNVLNNAAKYTDESGHIFLNAALLPTTASGEQRVAITIRDNGLGISAELLPRVFDLFTQADPSPDRATGGLGIGLSLVKRLVELHGGAVYAGSAGAGCGSEFVVVLPVSTCASDRAPTISPAFAGRQT